MERTNRFSVRRKFWRFLVIVALMAFPVKLTEAADKKSPTPPMERFDLRGRPDPFRPFLERDARIKRAQERLKVMPLSPLLQSPVRNFRLTGIMGADDDRVAVVEDGQGRFFLLFPGSNIGTRSGRVAGIHKDHIVIEERTKIPGGREKREEIKLRFR